MKLPKKDQEHDLGKTPLLCKVRFFTLIEQLKEWKHASCENDQPFDRDYFFNFLFCGRWSLKKKKGVKENNLFVSNNLDFN